VKGTMEADVTLVDGVLHVHGNALLIGPGPARNIVVRMKIMHQEGKGMFLNFRHELTDPRAAIDPEARRIINWNNGRKRFELQLKDPRFPRTFRLGYSDRDELQEGEYYEWMCIADGDSLGYFINGKSLQSLRNKESSRGYFTLAVADGEATIKQAEYRLLGEETERGPDLSK